MLHCQEYQTGLESASLTFQDFAASWVLPRALVVFLDIHSFVEVKNMRGTDHLR